MDDDFLDVCRLGDLEEAKRIWKLYPGIKPNINLCFKLACDRNNLELAEWAWNVDPDNRPDIKEVFYYACLRDNIDLAKWLWNLNPDPNLFTEAFFIACERGNLEIAKWLLDLNPDNRPIDQNLHSDCFREACLNNHFDMAKWLWNLEPDKRPDYSPDSIFSGVCVKGNLDFAKWIWNLDENNRPNHRINNDLCFRAAFSNDNLEAAKWLWNLDENNRPNHRINNDLCFRGACVNDNLEAAKWLWNLDENNRPNHRVDNDQPFRDACTNGNLEMVEWLWNLDENNRPNIHANNDEAFKNACSNGNLQAVKFLYNLDPRKYRLNIKMCYDGAIESGNLELIKWLWKLDPKLLNNNIDRYFYKAGRKGYLDIAKWLWNLDPKNRPKRKTILDLLKSPYMDYAKWLKYAYSNWLKDLHSKLKIGDVVEFGTEFCIILARNGDNYDAHFLGENKTYIIGVERIFELGSGKHKSLSENARNALLQGGIYDGDRKIIDAISEKLLNSNIEQDEYKDEKDEKKSDCPLIRDNCPKGYSTLELIDIAKKCGIDFKPENREKIKELKEILEKADKTEVIETMIKVAQITQEYSKELCENIRKSYSIKNPCKQDQIYDVDDKSCVDITDQIIYYIENRPYLTQNIRALINRTFRRFAKGYCKMGQSYIDMEDYSDQKLEKLQNECEDCNIIGFFLVDKLHIYCEKAEDLFHYWKDKWNRAKGIIIPDNKDRAEFKKQIDPLKANALAHPEKMVWFVNFPLMPRVFIERNDAKKLIFGNTNFYALVPTNLRFIDTIGRYIGSYHNYNVARGEYGDILYKLVPIGTDTRKESMEYRQLFTELWNNMF